MTNSRREIEKSYICVVEDRSVQTLRIVTAGIYVERDYYNELEMWANAQRDGRPAKYRWRPLFNAAKFR